MGEYVLDVTTSKVRQHRGWGMGADEAWSGCWRCAGSVFRTALRRQVPIESKRSKKGVMEGNCHLRDLRRL